MKAEEPIFLGRTKNRIGVWCRGRSADGRVIGFMKQSLSGNCLGRRLMPGKTRPGAFLELRPGLWSCARRLNVFARGMAFLDGALACALLLILAGFVIGFGWVVGLVTFLGVFAVAWGLARVV